MPSCTLYGCDSDSDAVITVERPGPPGFGWRQARACLDHMEEVALWLVQPAEEILRRGDTSVHPSRKVRRRVRSQTIR